MDLGRLPPFQRARQNFGSGRVRITRRARRAPVCSLPSPDAPPGEPAGAIPSGSTRRRDDDRERHDWAQWDERTNDLPTAPVRALLIGGPRLRLDRR